MTPHDDMQDRFFELLQSDTVGQADTADPGLAAACSAYQKIESAFAALRGSSPSPDEEAVPEIPGYDDLHFLAQGGQARVYRARDTSLKRPVALKVVRVEESSRRGRFLFQSEAEVAASFDHPHIVPVYEIGSHQDLHYIAMAFVDGESLATKISRKVFPPREAAELTHQITSAVEHAHQLGVVHRDLKPANVLIDREGRPRLTDFGLAKVLETAATPQEASRQVVGTPGFMPPEQARGDSMVGPQVDVYSLGAVLYALLTGRPPFQSGNPVDTLRQVTNSEPVRPRDLNPSVDRDLETICLRCLEKLPSRRYAIAASLADDLRRYLDGKPILARPISLPQRVGRWARRKPGLAGLSSALLLAVVFGFAAVTWQWRIARRNAKEAQSQTALAKEHLAQARSAVNDYLTVVSEEVLLEEPGMQPVRRKLLQRALSYYEEFIDRHNDDEQLLSDLATARMHIARIVARTGDAEQALARFRAAQSDFEKLASATPGHLGHRAALARCRHGIAQMKRKLGRLQEAVESYRNVIELEEFLVEHAHHKAVHQRWLGEAHRGLGLAYRDMADHEAALRCFRKAGDLQRQGLISFQNSRTDSEQSHSADELSRYRAASADAQLSLGNALLAAQRADEALRAYREAISLRETIVREQPRVSRYRSNLASSYNNLAVWYDRQGQLSESIAWHRKSIALQQELVRHDPLVQEYQQGLGMSYHNLGLGLFRSKQLEPAAEAGRKAVEVRRKLAGQNKEVIDYQVQLAASYNSLGLIQKKQRQSDPARKNLVASIRLLDVTTLAHPNLVEYRDRLAAYYLHLANLERQERRLEKWSESVRKALAIRAELSDIDPNSIGRASKLGVSAVTAALWYHKDGDLPQALNAYEQGIEALERVVASDASDQKTTGWLRSGYGNRAKVLQRLKKYRDAAADWDRAAKLTTGNSAVFRLQRAWNLAMASDHRAASAEARRILAEKKASGEVHYRAATVFAACSTAAGTDSGLEPAERRRLVEKYAARAVQLLVACRGQGYLDKPRMKKAANDPAFRSIRQRDDYQSLIASIAADPPPSNAAQNRLPNGNK